MSVISVIMSVYNSENYLKDSVESILKQTFSDFEFIITDDGSTDNTLKILKKYAEEDNRIKLLVNSENLGIPKSVNKMFDVSNGEFIARMDADDISHVQRFEKQISFMQNNSDIGFCGTNSEFFGKYVNKKYNHWIFDHEEIRAALLFRNVIANDTALIRKKVIDQYKIRYNENYKAIQDYELWSRLISLTKFFIIPEVLLKVRVTDTGITATSSKIKNYRENLLRQVYRNLLENMGVSHSEEELFIHDFIASKNNKTSIEHLKNGEKWLIKLYNYNYIHKVYDERTFGKLLNSYWLNLCHRASYLGLPTAIIFFNSSLYKYKNYTIKGILSILVKCLIRYKRL